MGIPNMKSLFDQLGRIGDEVLHEQRAKEAGLRQKETMDIVDEIRASRYETLTAADEYFNEQEDDS